MIDPPTVYAGCVDGMAIGAGIAAIWNEHIGILLTYGSVVVGAITWAFMGG